MEKNKRKMPKHAKDITNVTVGILKALRFSRLEQSQTGRYYEKWIFLCACGRKKMLYKRSVMSGNTKSCGCIARKKWKEQSKTHGLSSHRIYSIWYGMKYRTMNKNCGKYEFYGGKGIKICSRWLKFENFAEDMKQSHDKHVKQYGIFNTTIDRIDSSGDYEPKNCRWATQKEQYANRKIP